MFLSIVTILYYYGFKKKIEVFLDIICFILNLQKAF